MQTNYFVPLRFTFLIMACLAIIPPDIIHGNFKYQGKDEIGIFNNMNLIKIPFFWSKSAGITLFL